MDGRWIRISIARQVLELFDGSRLVAAYPVSTAAKGVGERIGSEQTPRGALEVKELIGHGAPRGTVFVGRQSTGEIYTDDMRAANSDRDWILSRVIWLGGLEDDRNLGGSVDTFARHIYIHGTADDEHLGEARSHGCIRMRSDDVIELFDAIEPGTLVHVDE